MKKRKGQSSNNDLSNVGISIFPFIRRTGACSKNVIKLKLRVCFSLSLECVCIHQPNEANFAITINIEQNKELPPLAAN